MIEVAELQRVLFMSYSRFELDDDAKRQVKRAQRELDYRIDHLARAYDMVSPVPIFRRKFLTWL